ncbi:hypothetical protein ACIQV3_01850 [Streptomyces sp. NPDC099050]|uniref:hypothetical protein n=1 Tax=Streptomyces sp. NPDC099050 TaxID=3366100 RepID=UPI0038124861
MESFFVLELHKLAYGWGVGQVETLALDTQDGSAADVDRGRLRDLAHAYGHGLRRPSGGRRPWPLMPWLRLLFLFLLR